MRIVVAVMVGLSLASLLRGQDLLPPSHAGPCPSKGRPGFPFTDRDSLRRTWYGAQWRALRETNLCAQVGQARQVLRFVWVPSFHPTIAVIVRDEGGKYVLWAKKLSGAGGYEPGKLARDTTFVLTRTQWDTLVSLVGASGFLSKVGVPPTPLGLDGAQWVLEWSGGGKYYVVDRWSPHPGGPAYPFRQVGEWLLRLSSLVADSVVVGY